MRRILSTLMTAGLLWMALPLSAARVTVDTRPLEVTVFPQGAKVVRAGGSELEPGLVTVLFPGVPSEADESSIRLSVEGPQGTKLFGVRFSQSFSPEAVEKRRRLLEEQIQGLEDDKAALGDQALARQAEIEILKALSQKDAAQASAGKTGSLKELPAALAGVGKRLAELLAANRKDQKRIRSLDKEMAALREEMEQGGSDSRRLRAAEADLELPAAGQVKFRLSYQVASASWSPVYDVRLEGDKVALTFNGSVTQQTGEDWKGVKLGLSTARQSAMAQIPDPTQWWLDYAQVYYGNAARLSVGKSRKGQSEAAAPSMPAPMDSAAEMVQVQPETAETLEGNYATTFQIKREADVKSDGSSHRVGIAETSHPVTLSLVAVPRLAQAAFVQAHIKYEGNQPLLPGPAFLFDADQYVGKVGLAPVGPGETFDLSFGVDDQVKVKRTLLVHKSGEAGFVFVKGQRNYEWQTVISNFHSDARTVEVKEQLPRSRQKEIEVKALVMDPKPLVEDESQPGLLRWNLTLPPKGESKILFRYQVKFPENQRISGME